MFTITQKCSGRSMTLADHCESKVHSDVQDVELITELAGKYNWHRGLLVKGKFMNYVKELVKSKIYKLLQNRK